MVKLAPPLPAPGQLGNKHMSKMIGVAIAAGLALLGSAAVAATPPDLCPDGKISVLRISTLKADGARDQFDKAEREQVAWYRSHGFTENHVLVGSVMTQDPKTKEWTVSPSEVVTLHVASPGPAAKHDAAYDAFAADYHASTDIKTEKVVCLREPAK